MVCLRTKYKFLVILSIVIIGIILSRAFYLQILNGANFRKQISDMKIKKIDLPPIRGNILDINDRVLATNIKGFYVSFLPLNGYKENEVREVAKILGVEFETFDSIIKSILNNEKYSQYSSIKLKAYPITQNQAVQIDIARLSTFKVEEFTKRYYPTDTSLFHVLGYVGRPTVKDKNYFPGDIIGKNGLEKEYENYLKGMRGTLVEETDAAGKVRKVIYKKDSISGFTIKTSIDLRLQAFVADLMRDEPAPGVIIVSNPKNGSIMAAVSKPWVDPNFMSYGIKTIDDWKKIVNNPEKPLMNRIIHPYQPGSIIKPLLAFGLIENGDEDKTYDCTGKLVIPNPYGKSYVYRDWDYTGHGPDIGLKEALAYSCNIFFYHLGMTLGITKMAATLNMFDIGSKTGIDIPYEGKGLIPTRRWKEENVGEKWYLGDSILTAIGQGYLKATPIELIMALNSLINYGEIIQPHFLIDIEKDDKIIKKEKINILKKIQAPKSTFKVIVKGMEEVVKYGTAEEAFRGCKYSSGGKTGTAQTGNSKTHAWYFGFSPLENPQISVLVFLENGGYGGENAAPLARKIMDFYYFLRNGEK